MGFDDSRQDADETVRGRRVPNLMGAPRPGGPSGSRVDYLTTEFHDGRDGHGCQGGTDSVSFLQSQMLAQDNGVGLDAAKVQERLIDARDDYGVEGGANQRPDRPTRALCLGLDEEDEGIHVLPGRPWGLTRTQTPSWHRRTRREGTTRPSWMTS